MSEKLQKTYAWILTGGGFAGLVAMTWQAAERVAMLKNHGNVLITGYVLMAMLYFLRFQDYYFG